MLAAFQTHIESKFPELRSTPFLLACSGGIDSMVLANLCARCEMDFALAHCNFRLRGADSDGDEKFVEKTANTLNLKFYVTHFDTKDYIKIHKVSVQIAARELRYAWLEEIMQQNGIQTLVTAHHADDNLETFLINLSRGTGIEGLIGIPEKTDRISRPLLPFAREDIAAYAHAEHIEWREDSSNADSKYLRNNIRHQILPQLKALNPNFLGSFRDTQRYLKQTAVIAATHIRQSKAAIFQREGNRVKISIKELQSLKPLPGYLFAFFSEYGFTEWNDIENLLTAMSGKEVRSKSHRLVKDRDFLLLTENRIAENRTYHILKNQTKIEEPVPMSMTIVDAMAETGRHILYVPKNALKYPLDLRKCEKGDYFCPFGMKGKKKVSKFFKDEKMDVLAKENQWLLCSDGVIVWVVGRRADERFKVSENTEEIVKFELKL